jgi:hypothetical protein
VAIRNELEKLSLTHAWSLRETDLYDFQRQLDQIDESRVNGNFRDKDGNPAELYVQRVGLMILIPIDQTTDCLDITVPDSAKLWLHLLPYGLFRACIRGSLTSVQPTSNLTAVLNRSQEFRGRQLAKRALSLQHESKKLGEYIGIHTNWSLYSFTR